MAPDIPSLCAFEPVALAHVNERERGEAGREVAGQVQNAGRLLNVEA